jgi:hypothetical protein
MSGETEISRVDDELFGSNDSPDDIFRHIRNLFTDLGIFGSVMCLVHDGIPYRISCDENAFMVYRANDSTGSRHHVPGWPVCLVTAQQIFEECRTEGLGSDHHACVVELTHWLDMVMRHVRLADQK